MFIKCLGSYGFTDTQEDPLWSTRFGYFSYANYHFLPRIDPAHDRGAFWPMFYVAVSTIEDLNCPNGNCHPFCFGRMKTASPLHSSLANSREVPLWAWPGERSDANRLESFNAAGDCTITQEMQVNVGKGRELWEVAPQTQQDLLNRTVMQCAEQEGETRVKMAAGHPCSFIHANHGRDGGLRNKIRTNTELTPTDSAFTVCALVQG